MSCSNSWRMPFNWLHHSNTSISCNMLINSYSKLMGRWTEFNDFLPEQWFQIRYLTWRNSEMLSENPTKSKPSYSFLAWKACSLCGFREVFRSPTMFSTATTAWTRNCWIPFSIPLTYCNCRLTCCSQCWCCCELWVSWMVFAKNSFYLALSDLLLNICRFHFFIFLYCPCHS